jgi:NAD(P)-dependent dehydrogenase (short-subunit alcohol dehydrogenase family)
LVSTLEHKTALVTGAGRSVGRGIAEVLAEAGALVVVNDLHAARAEETVAAIERNGGRARASIFDVTDLGAVRGAVDDLAGAGTGIDILVNNAGIAEGGPTGGVLFATSDPGDWTPALEINICGAMNTIRSCLPRMIEERWGRIVQISSGAGSVGLAIGVSPYGAAKAATESLVRHVAVENAAYGITANALSLGLMANVDASGGMDGGEIDETFQRMVAGIPVRRLGQPREVGAAAAFLASDDAGYITGQVIHVNGGTVFGR